MPTAGQNCTLVRGVTNADSCDALRVQASAPLRPVRALKRQAKSLMALAISCEPPNTGGLTAGTPPSGGAGPSSQIDGAAVAERARGDDLEVGQHVRIAGRRVERAGADRQAARSFLDLDDDEEALRDAPLEDRRAVAGDADRLGTS